jgi:hypothetical protein
MCLQFKYLCVYGMWLGFFVYHLCINDAMIIKSHIIKINSHKENFVIFLTWPPWDVLACMQALVYVYACKDLDYARMVHLQASLWSWSRGLFQCVDFHWLKSTKLTTNMGYPIVDATYYYMCVGMFLHLQNSCLDTNFFFSFFFAIFDFPLIVSIGQNCVYISLTQVSFKFSNSLWKALVKPSIILISISLGILR